jgi:hypothetical protein
MSKVVIRATKKKKHVGRIASKVEVRNKSNRQVVHLSEEETPTGSVRAGHVAYLREVVSVKVTTQYNSCGVEVGAEVPFPCKPGDLQSIHRNMDRLSKLIESRFVDKMKELKKVLSTLGGG